MTFGTKRILRRSSEFLESSGYSDAQTMDNTPVLVEDTREKKTIQNASMIRRRLSQELFARKPQYKARSYQIDAA